MARYTSSFMIVVPYDSFYNLMKKVLESCNLEMVYNTNEYIMAREKPGKVPFAKLVTIELLIDKNTGNEGVIKMSVVVKNEELPLQINNHCQQIYTTVIDAITAYSEWEIIESLNN